MPESKDSDLNISPPAMQEVNAREQNIYSKIGNQIEKSNLKIENPLMQKMQ